MSHPLVARFESILTRYAPETLESLEPGASVESLDAYRAEFPDVGDLWMELHAWRDGSGDFGSIWQGNEYVSLASSKSTKDIMDELEADGTFDRWAPNEWWNPAWIPIFDNRSYDTYCIDTAGCFGGSAGQIVHWSKDSSYRSVVAPSLEAWLTTFCDLVEEGELVWDADEGGFNGTEYRLVNNLISARFEGFPFGAEVRTRLELGMVRVPKPADNIHRTEGLDVEIVAQLWAPGEVRVSCLEWCGAHGLAVGQSAFGDAPCPALSLVDPETGEIRHEVWPTGSEVMAARWLPERQQLAFLVNATGCNLYVWDAETKTNTPLLEELWETRMHDAFDAAGQLVLHAGESLRLFDLEAVGVRTVPLAVNGGVSGALNPDGTELAAHLPGGPIRIFSTDTLEVVREISVETETFSVLRYGPNGRLFGIGQYGSSFEIWDDGVALELTETPYTPFVVASDGEHWATAGYSGAVTIHADDGSALYFDNAHRFARTYGLTFGDDGRLFAGGDDGQISIRVLSSD